MTFQTMRTFFALLAIVVNIATVGLLVVGVVGRNREESPFEFLRGTTMWLAGIVALGATHGRNEADSSVLLEYVVRVACQAGPLAVTVPRISSDEIAWAELESMGFRKGQTYTRYAEFPGSRMH